ncbi:3-deoxy-D-manno-octulosonic acid transferase [Ruegeria arenilitoris]|uniref:3-deoxy-D-manno-octulosonic acid transferase n=1 Tax=Ruegeria arenilitoris TaxID=1173585 RepID=UPI001479BF3C|nr:glycosyltransferase N-terminal domain-containing protein [Ruegeria arenilitoris]
MSKPRSLSLAAYRALSWGVPKPPGHNTPPRPAGELLWIHVANEQRLRAVNDFCKRLQQSRPGLSILLTVPPDADLTRWAGCDMELVPLPDEKTGAARGFLEHWQPDMGLWVGGGLMPNVITRAAERGIPMVLLEGENDVRVAFVGKWLPDINRYTFDCFRAIHVTSEDAARQIRRLGVPASKVALFPPLSISPTLRPWPEDELIETNHALAGRPVWLAAWVDAKEFISVLSAHRQAMRMLPRLALILHVADMSEAAPLRKRLETMDLRCANWEDGDMIEDMTQVILASDPEALGLWYRVSPVTFMGSTLESGIGGHDPIAAAALGSALIHGPDVSGYKALYDALDGVGAAREIRTATELGDTVVELLAPDLAANMALAGWQLVTESAPQVDTLIDMVQEHLDQHGAEHEGA